MRSRGTVATRGLQAGIVGLLVVGVVLRNLGVVVNALFALAATFMPVLLTRDWEETFDPRLTLYLSLAAFLHTVGMVGPYTTVPWWDHLTHTLSATVVAGVGYAVIRAFDEYSDAVEFPPRFLFVFVFLFTLALGVGWEVLEFAARSVSDALGVGAVLVQYGLEDTLADLAFDALGAAIVALLGRSTLESLAESIRHHLATGR